MLNKGFDFSFSGLKTAVLYAARDSHNLEEDREDIAASFQSAVIDVLINKTFLAIDRTGYQTVVIGGGVACNKRLAAKMTEAAADRARVIVAQSRLNADNAGMIARAGWYHLQQHRESNMLLDADPRMPWPGLELDPELFPTPS